MKTVLKYLTFKDRMIMAIIILLIIGQVYLDLLLPGYMAKITEFLQTEGTDMSKLVKYGCMMLLFAFISFLVSILSVILNSRIGSNYSASLRKGMFYKVQDMSMEEEHHFTIASLITRTTNDIGHVEMLVLAGAQMIVHAPILGIGALIKILGKDWRWSLATGVSIFLLILVMLIGVGSTIKKFKKIQSLTDSLNNVTRESIIGIQTVRAYNAEWYHEKKFNSVNDELTDTNIFTSIVMSFLSPILNLLMNGLTLAIYWIGMMLINQAASNEKVSIFSDMIAYSSYAMQLATAFLMLVSIFLFLPQAMVSVKRISEVLESESKIINGNFTETIKQTNYTQLEFNNVSFKYSNGSYNVLEDINFSAKSGETVAIIGSTGCGKTTLVNLIPRFYDATKGSIIINGIDVKTYEFKALRDKIGYISQKTHLLSGSVASNVAYSSDEGDINESKVNEAIRIANAEEFVSGLDDGINGVIAKDGTNLSGGQKQRLAIARAIYKNPEILIFDDSFSALDFRTDVYVRKALKEKCKDSIKIIVAQRINTIIDADKIIVLEKGRMAGIGTHNELMKSCEVYRQIVSSQLSNEEVQ